MTIRPMRPLDAAAVAELTTQLGYPVDEAAQRRRIEDVLESPTHHALFVAVDEADRAIGWVHVERIRYLEGDDTAEIMGLVVGDGHRSGGIGAELLVAAEAWAAKRGCRRVVVRSRVSRERAHRFYERQGYAVWKTSQVFAKDLG
jgi:GNAT superfamily N-acetyltransferase